MRINHVALYVNDLEIMKDFYIKYFRATTNTKYHNKKTGLQTYFLTFEGGARIELMNKPNRIKIKESSNQMGYSHVALSVGSKEKVDELTWLLVADGYKVISNPRTTGDGYYESCIADPEGNQIEIVE